MTDDDTPDGTYPDQPLQLSRRSTLRGIAFSGMCGGVIVATTDALDADAEADAPTPIADDPSEEVEAIEHAVCDAVNAARDENGDDLIPFAEDLSAVARYHSETMAEDGELDDAGPYFDSFDERFDAAEVPCDDAQWILDRDDTATSPDMPMMIAGRFLTRWMGEEEFDDTIYGDHLVHGTGVALADDGTIYVTYITCGGAGDHDMDDHEVDMDEAEAMDEANDMDDMENMDAMDAGYELADEDLPTQNDPEGNHGELTITVENDDGTPLPRYPVTIDGEFAEAGDYRTDENGETLYILGDGHQNPESVDVTVNGETQTGDVGHDADNNDVSLTFTVDVAAPGDGDTDTGGMENMDTDAEDDGDDDDGDDDGGDDDPGYMLASEDLPTQNDPEGDHGRLTVTVEDQDGTPLPRYPVEMNGTQYRTDEDGEAAYILGDGHDNPTEINVMVADNAMTFEVDHNDNDDVTHTFTISL